MHFSDYIPEPERRISMGFVYIGVFLANTFVHIIILIRDTCIKVKFVCRRCKYWLIARFKQ